MIPRQVTTRAALERRLGAMPEVARRLDKLGLLVPCAKTASRGGEVYFDVGLGAVLERAAALMQAGYAPKDVALVLGRVELARREPVVEVLPLADVAERARVAAARIVGAGGWLERGLVQAFARDDGDAPLFLLDAVARVRGLAALEALGLGELGADWVAGTLDATRVRARMDEVSEAVKVLERALPKPRRRKLRVRAATRAGRAR